MTVAVGVAVIVPAVGETAGSVTVIVPWDMGVGEGVFEGRGVIVGAGVRVGVVEGTAVVGWTVSVGVNVAAETAGAFAGTPDPIKATMTTANSRRNTVLTRIPEVVGRSFKRKSTNRPSVLANAK